ncbi:MAG: hypothetical protein AB7O43_10595 [Hyphomicrobiaceae bacterium]
METSEFLLLLWAALVFWVLGQIWLVQIVVYPLFAKVGEAEYVGYHRFYTRRIPLPVIIPGFASFLLRSGQGQKSASRTACVESSCVPECSAREIADANRSCAELGEAQKCGSKSSLRNSSS